MIKRVRVAGTCLTWVFFLFVAGVSIMNASTFGPRRPRRGPGPRPVPVAEPATIALLGAGLVSLGIYAKRKRGKKQ